MWRAELVQLCLFQGLERDLGGEGRGGTNPAHERHDAIMPSLKGHVVWFAEPVQLVPG